MSTSLANIVWAAGLSAACRPLRDAITILVCDRKMSVSVDVTDGLPPQVGRSAARGRAGHGWLGVGTCAGQGSKLQPAGRTDGHNIFLDHRSAQPGAPILCDFGARKQSYCSDLVVYSLLQRLAKTDKAFVFNN